MKGKIVIGKSSRLAYIPLNLREEGYIGEVETISNAATVTMLKPGAPLAEVRKSLEIVLLDLDLRIDRERRENNKETE